MRPLAAILIAAALLALLPATGMAEIIHLKGGAKISGVIVEQTETRVKLHAPLEKGSAVISIDRLHIERIEETGTFTQRLAAVNAWCAAGEYARAEEAVRALLKMDPRHAGARRALADALYGQYRYAEATKTLEHHALLAPAGRDPELLLQLAQYYLEAENYRDARRCARDAADLQPENRDFSEVADEFLKRVERVRSGTEQLKEREAAEKAAARQRREERATFDKARGNILDAQRASDALVAWSGETAPNIAAGAFVEIGAPNNAIAEYMGGADERQLQDHVTRALATVRVDETRWLALYDHEKAVYLYGWYYQLLARYPRTNPMVTVVNTVREGGVDKEKNLARATWDGRKRSVAIDRWTRENRDATRPVRRIVK